jgi:hypothetical protein
MEVIGLHFTLTKKGLGNFFDSFGQPPRKNHARFLKENCRYWNKATSGPVIDSVRKQLLIVE